MSERRAWFLVDVTSEHVPVAGEQGRDWFTVELVSHPLPDGAEHLAVIGGRRILNAAPVTHPSEPFELTLPGRREPANNWNEAIRRDEEDLLALIAAGVL